MDKERFMQNVQKMKTGERTRVLFDLLMETIGADPDITKAGLFELIKEKIEAEQSAMNEVMPSKKTRPKR